jgi:hypothetical protein
MSLGIPYMGSKRKLSSDILHFITSRHSGITDFYDLCGGGGSISFTAVKDYRFNVHYNELNKHIYSLVKYLTENKTLEPKFYEWVTREMFFEQIEKSNEDADWYSGFVMSCWSFGNNSEKGYMYGKEIEQSKMLAHKVIVECCLESMKLLNLNIQSITDIKDVNKRRIVFCDYMKKEVKYRDDITHLSNMQNLQYIQRLQNLQNLQNLQITNNSYENVHITGNNPVAYLDIPYKGTGEYKEGGFDYDKFYKWFEQLPIPAYLSEYNAPFEEVHAFKHRSSLSATNNKKVTIEKLFFNGKGNVNQTKLF